MKEPPSRPVRIIALPIARAAPAANGLDGSLGIRHIGAMAAGIEGVGEAVTGGMLAVAVERRKALYSDCRDRKSVSDGTRRSRKRRGCRTVAPT